MRKINIYNIYNRYKYYVYTNNNNLKTNIIQNIKGLTDWTVVLIIIMQIIFKLGN